MGRILLESYQHPFNLFVTLTYGGSQWSLEPSDLKLFIRRLSHGLGRKVRYFGVGEYGEQSERPHFHLALFGVGFDDVLEIESAWRYGFIHIGDLNEYTAQYICGYVVKKMTNKDHDWLNGRYPEFARMSLKPGLGAGFVHGVAKELETEGGSKALALRSDVPSELRVKGKKYPLGRYLRRQLRIALGMDARVPPSAIAEVKAVFEAEDPHVREVRRERDYDRAVQRSKFQKQKRRI